MTVYRTGALYNSPQEAFEASVNKYWEKLLAVAVAKTNRDDAFDIVQDVLLSIWEKWDQAPKDETLEFYLLHALKLRIYNYYRTTGRYQVHLQKLEMLLNDSVDEDFALAGEDLQTVRETLLEQAIETLTPNQQQLFMLRVRHQYSYQKIAEILNIEPGSARVLYSRALEQVRMHIKGNPSASAALVSAFVLFTIP